MAIRPAQGAGDRGSGELTGWRQEMPSLAQASVEGFDGGSGNEKGSRQECCNTY